MDTTGQMVQIYAPFEDPLHNLIGIVTNDNGSQVEFKPFWSFCGPGYKFIKNVYFGVHETIWVPDTYCRVIHIDRLIAETFENIYTGKVHDYLENWRGQWTFLK
jgi:hypothetical protein